jgi:hypothetical protein
MPGLEGPELAECVRPLRPEMKILFMSAYEVVHRLKPGVVLVCTPFPVKEVTAQLQISSARLHLFDGRTFSVTSSERERRRDRQRFVKRIC